MKASRFALVPLCLALAAGISGCNIQATTGDSATGEETPQEESSPKAEQVGVGETFTIPDMFEVTLDSAEWLDEVKFGGDMWNITVGEQKEGASYFVIHATVKNISTANETVGKGGTAHLTSSFTVNDKYDIESSMVVDTGNGNSYEIEPMMSANVVIYGSVSNEIKDEFTACDVTITAKQPDEDGVWHLDTEPIGTYEARFE